MSTPKIDCCYASLEEAVQGLEIPAEIRENLALREVSYISFDGLMHQGQLIVHAGLADEIEDLFAELVRMQFPVEKVIPIVAYGWDDEASMADNNSSAFNYRVIMGTDRLSNHSFGTALDLNPRQNPYFARGGKVFPSGATHDISVPGTIAKDSAVVRLFTGRGWTWGGSWTTPVDFQHFEKPIR